MWPERPLLEKRFAIHSRRKGSAPRLRFHEWSRIKLSNEESLIDFPTTPKMVNDRAVAMLTASSRSQPSYRQA